MAQAPVQVITIPQWREQMAALNGVVVKEKVRLLEVFTDIEKENMYDIIDNNGNVIMLGKEKSSFLMRQFCGTNRSWKFDMRQVVQGTKGSPFISLDKKFSCTCCCANRPKVTVFDVQSGRFDAMAKIKSPFSCCNCPLKVEDAEGKYLFKVELDGNCCSQPGILYPLPCGPCKKVHFKVVDREGNEFAFWEKKMPSMAFFTDVQTDNYKIAFGQNQSAEEKGLMLAAAMVLDMIYFSKPQIST